MNGIARAKRLSIKPFGPAFGVVVQANGVTRRSDVDMMSKSEIAKTEIRGNGSERFRQLIIGRDLAGVADERFYAAELLHD